MHKPEYVLENEKHGIISGVDAQMGHLKLFSRSDQTRPSVNKKKKKTCNLVYFASLESKK